MGKPANNTVVHYFQESTSLHIWAIVDGNKEYLISGDWQADSWAADNDYDRRAPGWIIRTYPIEDWPDEVCAMVAKYRMENAQ
jgi:hypothetical protein